MLVGAKGVWFRDRNIPLILRRLKRIDHPYWSLYLHGGLAKTERSG